MKVTPTSLPEVLLVEPKLHGDGRGFFYESFQALRYAEAGIPEPFVQDNDVRRGSPRFGKWVAMELSDASPCQLWIPSGFAHGFCVLSESADFFYKCTDYYVPEAERGIAWNDPALAIPWPVTEPLLSAKDRAAPTLAAAPVLPVFSR